MRRNGGVTISNVAAAAGVSVATVSRVMNGVPTVDPELAARVKKVAGQLGYLPSATAQNLARGRTGLVGVLVADLANPLFDLILKGIAAGAAEDGYRTLIADANETPSEELVRAEELARHTDGLILCGPRMPDSDLTELLYSARPIVVANRRPPRGLFPTVWVDSHEPLAELCRHLYGLGHRHFAYLAGPEHSAANRDRWAACEEAVANKASLHYVECGAMMQGGHEGADRALDTGATCLIAYNDLVALGALARVRELGMEVPGEVSIAGVDDIPYSRYMTPALTTVAIPKVDFGREAWRLLAPWLDDRKGRNSRCLSAELILRDSTGPAPT